MDPIELDTNGQEERLLNHQDNNIEIARDIDVTVEVQLEQPLQQDPVSHEFLSLVSLQVTINSKALAIFLVLFGHTLNSLNFSASIPVFGPIVYPLFRLATAGVGVFAFLSGYGLTKSEEKSGLDGFFVKRFSTVYIPFFLTVVCYNALFKNVFHSMQTFKNLLKMLVLFSDPTNPLDGTLWFIPFICGWYILFFIVFKIFKNRHVRVIVMFIIGIAGYVVFCYHNFGNWQMPGLYGNQMLQIPIGVLFATYEKSRFIQKYLKDKRVGLPVLFIHTAVFVFVYWKYIYLDPWGRNMKQQNFNNIVLTGMNILFGLWVPFFFTFFVKNANRVMDFIGNHSYEAYLIEGILLSSPFTQSQPENAIIFFITVFACAYAFKKVYQVVIKYFVLGANRVTEKVSGIYDALKTRFNTKAYSRL
ncbi:hypothetical protein CYY_006010 [Polysphondylium violaceum]|uniref:Acyltransferase 3 domain-containing protein n=1 Tax=Polysphondylium violaceum TaxID=133409 RepID=A0A8J4URS7_9MYCE|nr:hypothetical protein CYY_006010 [Polysphondylium violaceum]